MGILKTKFLNILYLLLYSLIFLGIGYGVAALISQSLDYNMQDVLFYEGIIVLMLGVMRTMKGNPSGVSLQALGQKNAQYRANENIKVTKTEREATNYHKNFMNHSVIDFAISDVVIILGGILIMALSALS